MKIIGDAEDLSPSAHLVREQKWARQYQEISATVKEKYAARIQQANPPGQLTLGLLQEIEVRFRAWWTLSQRI